MFRVLFISINILLIIFFSSGPLEARDQRFLSGAYCNQNLKEYKSEIDWDSIPFINNRREFAIYLNSCIEKRLTIIPFKLANGFKIDTSSGSFPGEKTMAINAYRWDFLSLYNDKNIQKLIYRIYYYPGLRISDAYLAGDTSDLTEDELKVYDIVVPYVEKIKRIKSDMVKEQLIHDRILLKSKFRAVNFKNDEYTLHNISALGIFLDDRGNCQAHSDAFLMLGRMVGLDIGIMRGIAFGATHMWNTIKLGNKSYFVDLSYNRNSFTDSDNKSYTTYYYFNAPRQIMALTHQWDRSFEINKISDTLDNNYFYGTNEHYNYDRKYFGIYKKSARDALDSIAKGVSQYGWKYWYAMIPYDKFYSNVKNVLDYFGQALTRENWYGNYYVNIKTTNKMNYMYYTFIIKK